jgi:O-glycosyl hydrolase
MSSRIFSVLILLAGFSLGRGAGQSVAASEVEQWWSSELHPESPAWFTSPPAVSQIPYALSRQPNLKWEGCDETKGMVFTVRPEVSFQTMLGIGTSLEATSIYAIRKNKTEAQIRDLLRTLVDPVNGLGFSLFRVTIGTSDFSDGRSVSKHPKGFYSYRDEPHGTFSIAADHQFGILETLQWLIEEAARLEPPVDPRFFASCWSPPGWMKTSNALIGGTLLSGMEMEWARYIRDFVEAYEREGIPIYAVTIQNEPNFVPDDYPGMGLTPRQEALMADALCTVFRGGDVPEDQRIDAKIWINDHNFEFWENADEVLNLLRKRDRYDCVDGVAFHNYSSAPAEWMSEILRRHPEKSVQLTEHAEWGVAGMHNLQQYFWNGSQSYVYWVPMSSRDLDEHNQGPYNVLGELSPTLLIQEEGGSPHWYRTPEYFLLSQFGRFIRPGAERIECSPGKSSALTAVAFKNPDHGMAVILVNQTKTLKSYTLRIGEERQVCGDVPAKSVSTLSWRAGS